VAIDQAGITLAEMMPQPSCAAVRALAELGLAIEMEIGGPAGWNGFGM
jgi:hypothetical protein